MNHNDIYEKVKMKIAISESIKEDLAMNLNKRNITRSIGIAACALIATTGIAFAGGKVAEKIWKTPEKVDVSYEITDKVKKENITQEEAEKKAIEVLEKIGFNSNIIDRKESKYGTSNQIDFIFYTEDNYAITINGLSGEFFDIHDEKPVDKEYYETIVKESEAIEKAKFYINLFGYNMDEYQLVQSSAEENVFIHDKNKTIKMPEGEKGSAYNISLKYNKKYGEVTNPYEYVDITINAGTDRLGMFRTSNIPFDNNETIISKDDAIEIAEEADKQIEANEVETIKAEKMVVKMNADAYERINNTEKYYEAVQTPDYPSENRNYYNVDEKVRNAWVVVINYKSNEGDDIVKRVTEGQYSYFVDATTGEIIGGYIGDYIAYPFK